KTIESNDLWAFFASKIQEQIEPRLPSSASATARDVVAQHFALAATAHIAQWMLSGLEVNPSLAIARMKILMTDQTGPALARITK
ncbi:MAG: TetR family transcriptional regulator, partial [Actinomyces sp.]